MRYGMLALGIAGCLGLYQGWFARVYDDAIATALTEEAHLAIDTRCPGGDSRAARECRAMLKKLYIAGALDPDKTLRTYCDRVKNGRIGGSRPAPPALCVQRYGGWQAG